MLKIFTVAVASLYATAIMVEQVSSNNETCIGEFCFTTPGSNEVKDFYDAKSWCNEQDTTLAVVNNSYTQAAFTQFLYSSSIGLMSFVNIKLDQYANTWFLVNGSKYQGKLGNQDVGQYKVFSYLKPVQNAEFVVEASNPNGLRKYVFNFERTKCLSNSTSNFIFMGLCYVKYESENVTWYQARERCINYGGDLAQFQSQNGSTNLWIPPFDTSWLNQSLEYWVGIRWNGWSWKYPDGSELIYSSWSDGKPNNVNYQCVCVDPNGVPAWSWTDCDCSVQRPFVCLKIVPITTVPTTTLTTTTASTVTIHTTSAACKAEGTQGLVVGLVLGLVIILPLTIIIVVLIVCNVRQRRQLLDQRNNERETATVKASKANRDRSAATLDAADADAQYQQLKRPVTMLGSDTNMPLYDQLNQPGNQI